MRQRLGFLYHRACQGWLSLLMAYQMAEFFFGGRQYRKQKFLLCKSGSLKCIVDIKIKNPQSINPSWDWIQLFNYFIFVVAQVVHGSPVSWDWFFIHQRGNPCCHPAEAMVNDVAGQLGIFHGITVEQRRFLAILIPDHGFLDPYQFFRNSHQPISRR